MTDKSSCATDSVPIRIDQVPPCRFHDLVTLSGVAGTFCDGYTIGVMGAVLPYAASALQADTFGKGLLGSGTLFGLLVGTLITGSAADKWGRKPFLQMGMLWTVILSLLQLFATSLPFLFLLRFALGCSLAADYVAGAVYLIEFLPSRKRGSRLSLLLVSWTLGFAVAFQVAFLLTSVFQTGWRISLALSGVPALFACLLRTQLPESIAWLNGRSRHAEAHAIAERYFPRHNLIMSDPKHDGHHKANSRMTWSGEVWKRLSIAFIFMITHIVPYFCVGTFLIEILGKMGINDAYLIGVIYTAFLVVGSLLGKLAVDSVSRKIFLTITLLVPSIILLILASRLHFSIFIEVILFSIFALMLSASCCMDYVYMPELFPVHIRTLCNGIVQSGTRFCVAVSTLVFPFLLQDHGIDILLKINALILFVGGLSCFFFAPDTRRSYF